MTARHNFTLGSRVNFENAIYTIKAFGLGSVTLESASGETIRVADRLFLAQATPHDATSAHTTNATIGDEPTQQESLPRPADFALVPRSVRDKALERERHIRQVLTGYPSGSESLDKPDPRFDPNTTTLAERITTKAEELGIGDSTLRRWLANYLAAGPASCIDRRALKPSNPIRNVDSNWLACLQAVLDDNIDHAKLPQRVLIERANAAFLVNNCSPTNLPSPHKAKRALKHLARGTYVLKGSTKTKRSNANRPSPTGVGLRAHHPGEYIALDTTTLNIFAMDYLTGEWVRPELSVAIDVYSRCVVAVAVTPTTRAVDISGLIFEMLQPNSGVISNNSAVPDNTRLPFVGVPETLIIGDLTSNDTHASHSGLPGVSADTIIIDHGKAFDNEQIRTLCARLGMSIQHARVRMGADKGVVERVFRTIDTALFAHLPGYTGPDIQSRGLRPEDSAFWFINELEQMVRQYLHCYHHTIHSSLFNPRMPCQRLTPAEAFELGVIDHGGIDYPLDPDLAYEILPAYRRNITHEGFSIGSYRYQGPGLNGCRNQPSPDGGQWTVHRDPRDLRFAYFKNPTTGWQIIPWKHAAQFPEPFGHEAHDAAGRLALAQNRHTTGPEDLQELLQRWRNGFAENASARKATLHTGMPRRNEALRTQLAIVSAPVPADLVDDDDDDTELGDLT